MSQAWNRRIDIGLSPFEDEPYSISVAHYQLYSVKSLKEKLLQFPPGTLFTWGKRGGGVDESKAQQLFLQVKGYLEEHGMKLEAESRSVRKDNNTTTTPLQAQLFEFLDRVRILGI